MSAELRYRVYGTASLRRVWGDWLVYRKLAPADPRLPTLDDLRGPLGLEEGQIPRKSEPAYGRVVAEMLRQARRLDLPARRVERLVYIGDTRMNDGTAFRNLCAAGGWPGWAFIGADVPGQLPQVEVQGDLYLSNRWAALPGFLRFLEERDFPLDAGTAVVIDMDKTAVGARGRNDRVVDAARVEAVERTVAGLLGDSFDRRAFLTAYETLNRPRYHPFTGDNQDYLAYICLMLGAGLFTLGGVTQAVQAGRWRQVTDFLAQVERERERLAAVGLLEVHEQVWQCVQAGDPTPFKPFRRNEYLTTAARYGPLPGTSVEEVLEQRIVLTQEVLAAADFLRARGALIFGLSDKPDEASCPTPEQARQGLRPLHHLESLVVGEV